MQCCIQPPALGNDSAAVKEASSRVVRQAVIVVVLLSLMWLYCCNWFAVFNFLLFWEE